MTEAQLKRQAAEHSPREREIEAHNRRLEGYLEELDFAALSPEEMLSWASETFPNRAVLETSFQYTGVAMIHMAAQLGLDLRIATLDTLRLHPETYDFIAEVKARYNCDIEVCRPDATQVESMTERFGEYLFFDSKERQEYCCQVRKERPHDELMKTADCWISGLRRDQSSFRRDTTSTASLVPEYGPPQDSQAQSAGRLERGAPARLHRRPPGPRASALRPGVSQFRLHHLLHPHPAGRRQARRPLALVQRQCPRRQRRQKRVRSAPARPALQYLIQRQTPELFPPVSVICEHIETGAPRR